MKQFTAVLRRAGLQTDQSLVTTESLHQIVAETSVPFSITPTEFGGPEIGRVTRIWVEDDELRGEVELDGISDEPPTPEDIAHGQSLAEALAEEPCCFHPEKDTCDATCHSGSCDSQCCPKDDAATDPQSSASS
jgi:hypothetical protein